MDSDESMARLIEQVGREEIVSAEALLPALYAQLRVAAQKQLDRERSDHTLQATALVHEAYLKIAGPRKLPWQNKAHFFVAAAQAMRQVLIDHARAKSAAIRGGAEARRAAMDLASLPDLSSPSESAGFLILDEAIVRLEGVDVQAASVVRLRYFSGLSVEETAEVMDISPATVKRAWAFARGWLKDALETDLRS